MTDVLRFDSKASDIIVEASSKVDAGKLPFGKELRRERLGPGIVSHQDFRNRRFDDVNGAKVTFESCDFSYSVFERGYFHSAIFRNCKFVGCKFYDSNFRMANLYKCDFKYSLFYSTICETKEIILND